MQQVLLGPFVFDPFATIEFQLLSQSPSRTIWLVCFPNVQCDSEAVLRSGTSQSCAATFAASVSVMRSMCARLPPELLDEQDCLRYHYAALVSDMSSVLFITFQHCWARLPIQSTSPPGLLLTMVSLADLLTSVRVLAVCVPRMPRGRPDINWRPILEGILLSCRELFSSKPYKTVLCARFTLTEVPAVIDFEALHDVCRRALDVERSICTHMNDQDRT